MPTLRCILKYRPAVMMGLLVVAWVVSWYGLAVLSVRNGRWYTFIGQEKGTMSVDVVGMRHGMGPFEGWTFITARESPRATEMAGRFFGREKYPSFDLFVGGAIPHLCLITAILPLAIGPFLSLRFRLWHYLAFTALVAVELAYYLRWQE